jgi:glucan endo-1,3-beta-D-glucosidase
MYTSLLLAVTAALLGGAEAAGKVPQGFNYSNMKGQGFKEEADYVKEFTAAKNLAGTDGAYTSARLYTCVQGGTKDEPNEAFKAAIKTKTSLLLGIWASGDPAGFQNELVALGKALQAYPELEGLIDGLSIGNEDLYRISPIGILNKSGPGLGPDELVSYIKQARSVLAKNDKFKDVQVGHVDTWTAWVNGTNQEVIDNCDWLGFDGYPYWQATMPNNISMAGALFFDALDKTKKAAGKKPVWITETGWPVNGNKSNLAVADEPTAELFYKGVGCKILGTEPTWWYILNEHGANPDFSVATPDYKPLYDLNCADAKNADPLVEGKPPAAGGIDNPSSPDGGDNSTDSSSTTGGSDSASSTSTSTGAGASSTNAGSATHAADCMFALILAGVVALMA